MRNRECQSTFVRWPVLIALVVISLMIGWHATRADAPAKPLKYISKEAGDAQDQYAADTAKLKNEYLDKVNAAQQQYLKRLDACLTDETRKGDFDGAQAIRQEITTQKNSSPDAVLQQALSQPNAFLDGKWHLRAVKGPSELDFHDKLVERNEGQVRTSSYTIENGSVVIRWSSGSVDRLTPVQNRMLFESWSAGDALHFPAQPSGFGIAERAQ